MSLLHISAEWTVNHGLVKLALVITVLDLWPCAMLSRRAPLVAVKEVLQQRHQSRPDGGQNWMCKVCVCVWFLAFIRFSPYCLHDHIRARRWYIVLPTLNVNASAQCANQSRAAGWRGFFALWCLLLLSRLKNKSHFKVRWKQTRARLRTFCAFLLDIKLRL